MILANGIAALSLTANVMGRPNTVHPTVVWDDRGALLIDAGYPGQADLVRSELNRIGLAAERLTRIAVTHQDIDHIGSLPALLQDAPGRVETLASVFEKPYVEGGKRLLRLTPEAIEQAVNALPPNVPPDWRQAFRRSLEHPPTAPISGVLADGDEIDCAGGLVVIGTPGHTPGHLSFYHKRSKTLVAGDALTASDGELFGPDPVTTLDPDEARRSLSRLAAYEIGTVVCYHGGLYRGDFRRRLKELL